MKGQILRMFHGRSPILPQGLLQPEQVSGGSFHPPVGPVRSQGNKPNCETFSR